MDLIQFPAVSTPQYTYYTNTADILKTLKIQKFISIFCGTEKHKHVALCIYIVFVVFCIYVALFIYVHGCFSSSYVKI